MAFGAVVALTLWRQRQRQEQQLAQALLSLERQRLAALRGQLEPHFMSPNPGLLLKQESGGILLVETLPKQDDRARSGIV